MSKKRALRVILLSTLVATTASCAGISGQPSRVPAVMTGLTVGLWTPARDLPNGSSCTHDFSDKAREGDEISLLDAGDRELAKTTVPVGEVVFGICITDVDFTVPQGSVPASVRTKRGTAVVDQIMDDNPWMAPVSGS